MNISFQAE